MSRGGAIKPVYVVAAAELELNGGDFVLQQGSAVKVIAAVGDIQGGASQPVYVLAAADARFNGGRWIITAGEPVKVVRATAAQRNFTQGSAIAVWPVDANGVYDPTF